MPGPCEETRFSGAGKRKLGAALRRRTEKNALVSGSARMLAELDASDVGGVISIVRDEYVDEGDFVDAKGFVEEKDFADVNGKSVVGTEVLLVAVDCEAEVSRASQFETDLGLCHGSVVNVLDLSSEIPGGAATGRVGFGGDDGGGSRWRGMCVGENAGRHR